ncbi:MAG TPA: sulfotransferase [Caulobacteraceae bacterium]|nr:sulfotransferase [Caulobacteraceae bacterium]
MAARADVDIDALLNQGAAHYAANRLDAAARAYAAAERADARDFRAPYSLAMIDIATGQLPSAAARLKRTLKLRPGLFPALFNLGRVSEQLGRWGDAIEAWRGALAERRDATDARFALAVALCTVGRIEAGVAEYRALADDARLGPQALARLALIRPDGVDDAELAAIDRLVRDGPPGETGIGLRFALGEVLEARGRYDEAFAAFEAANRAKVRALAAAGPASDPRNAAALNARSIAQVQALMTEAFLSAHRGDGVGDVAPIFIVGMPRSGSTLIEQIIASHPAVEGMGETPILAELLRQSRAYDPAVAKEKGFFRRLGEAYLGAMRQRGWTRKLRLVDKTLESFLHVGMLHLMFPRAVILESVRDPLDTCVACWRQLFTHGNETLYDLAQIGEAYRGYRQMMDHWAKVLPGRVVQVSNEALVADPEAQIRWLVTDACGLAWDPRCLAFHKTERPVATASAAQVRQPIFASSIGRWRRYEGRLGPLIEALGEYAPTRI